MANDDDDSWAKVKEGVKEKKSLLLLEALPKIEANSGATLQWDFLSTLAKLVLFFRFSFWFFWRRIRTKNR